MSGDTINVDVKLAVGANDLHLPYGIQHFIRFETAVSEARQQVIKFEFPISHEVAEANQRELAAVFSALLKDGHDAQLEVAKRHGAKPVDELEVMLKQLGLAEHLTKFRAEGIDLNAARKLGDEHFSELGLDYSARSSLSSALAQQTSTGPSVVIENGRLTGTLPIVTYNADSIFELLDAINAFTKLELAVGPTAQGGLEAVLTGRTSRSGLNEIALKRPQHEKNFLMFLGVLANASLRLDLHDLLAIIKLEGESRMVPENERIHALGDVVAKIQASTLEAWTYQRNNWNGVEPRWFALLKATGEVTLGKGLCLRFSADDLDAALMFYPPAARELAPLPAGESAKNKVQLTQQKTKKR